MNSFFELIKKDLYTPVVADVLDNMGLYNQALPPEIRPIAPEMKIAGRAMPVAIADIYGKQDKPFSNLLRALDQVKEDEVYIAQGGVVKCADWGELLTATVKAKGAAGAIVNSYHRDTRQVLEQNFPVFSRGYCPLSSETRSIIIDYRCPIIIGGVSIKPGDLIFGDIDGIIVIPREVEQEVIEKSLENAKGEKTVRKEVEKGASIIAVYEKYGLL